MSEKSETWSKYWDHNDVEYKQGSLNGDKLESIQPNFPAVLFNNILQTRELSLSGGGSVGQGTNEEWQLMPYWHLLTQGFSSYGID
jgi:hypothetical protein